MKPGYYDVDVHVGTLRGVRVDKDGKVFAITKTNDGPVPMQITIIGGVWHRIDIVKEARECADS